MSKKYITDKIQIKEGAIVDYVLTAVDVDGNATWQIAAGGIALTDLSATNPILYNNTTGVFSHATTAGNKHIPTAGAANQYLKYSASGTAVWSALPASVDSLTIGNGIANSGTAANPVLALTTLSSAWNAGSTYSITAGSFLEGSLRILKENILPFNKSGLDIINSLDIVTYDKIDGAKDKVGIIIEDSPKEIANEDQTAVDLYKTIFVQAKAIQELTARLEKLEKLLL